MGWAGRETNFTTWGFTRGSRKGKGRGKSWSISFLSRWQHRQGSHFPFVSRARRGLRRAPSWERGYSALLSLPLFSGSPWDFSNFVTSEYYCYFLPVSFFYRLVFFTSVYSCSFLLIGGKGFVKTKGEVTHFRVSASEIVLNQDTVTQCGSPEHTGYYQYCIIRKQEA